METVTEDFPLNVDLLIIIGTSLTVYPACSYVELVNEHTPRIVCNLDPVGSNVGIELTEDGNSESRDIWLRGDSDDVILGVAIQLGWLEDLLRYKDKMCEKSKELLRA
jgi:NAD-dependent SIR2 family protein deacetylase